jgi:hypothetical protein
VDETHKVWLAQLAWEKQEYAGHIQALSAIKAKRKRERCARDRLLMLHLSASADAGSSFLDLWSNRSDCIEIAALECKLDCLHDEKQEHKDYIRKSERTIADLERKLENMRCSDANDE